MPCASATKTWREHATGSFLTWTSRQVKKRWTLIKTVRKKWKLQTFSSQLMQPIATTNCKASLLTWAQVCMLATTFATFARRLTGSTTTMRRWPSVPNHRSVKDTSMCLVNNEAPITIHCKKNNIKLTR